LQYYLDIIFIDNDLRIVNIKENVQPCIHNGPCPSYSSKEPTKYVLDVNTGFAKQNEINFGNSLEI
jgi:uncharacterized membrane protein (UPF0127 family)